MSNIFTLDSLREEVEKEFAPVTIGLSDGTEVTLRNLLRLPKKTRDAVLETLKALGGVGDKDEVSSDEVDDLIDAASKILELVADQGKKLVKELDGDLALIMKVLEAWTEATQPGEARNSPDS